jgi:hypothetical protein
MFDLSLGSSLEEYRWQEGYQSQMTVRGFEDLNADS